MAYHCARGACAPAGSRSSGWERAAGPQHARSLPALTRARAPGDAYFRSGDLLRVDARGRFFFVDRIGDTYRWHGENVSTNEVAEALSSFPGVEEVNVYGVALPGHDGRCGMAALLTAGGRGAAGFDGAAFAAHARAALAPYAVPLFLRFLTGPDHGHVTTTFKSVKGALRAQGADPGAVPDPVWTLVGRDGKVGTAYAPLTPAAWRDIFAGGRARL